MACLQLVDIIIALLNLNFIFHKNQTKLLHEKNKINTNKPVLLKRKLAECTKVFELFSTIITDNSSHSQRFFFSLIKIFGLTFIRKLYMIANLWVKNNRKLRKDFFTIVNSILWNLNTLLMIKIKSNCLRSHQKINRLWKIKSNMLSFQL